jgi:hypothetical protein
MGYVNHGKPPGRKPKPFESYVEKTDGCWLWKGARHGNGYGSFRYNGKIRRAHHVAFEIHKGPLPKLGNRSSDLVVMHSCDNNMCVNPDHLSIGTKRKNTKDAMARSGGSQWAAERKSRHKFSRELAFELRQEGLGFKSIGRRLGVDPSSVKSALERYQNA